ncbi:MAG TPA: hypothetical protein VFA10_26225, partial [Ktedonobacteraceae bacterium]|nr:hypothetical protein [Ktedonobacteraceae bacterium]
MDYQLHPSRLGTKMGMEFLAEEVAHMHENLYPAPISAGKAECISSKLGLNVDLFNQALDFLSVNYKDVEKYKSITDIMYEACETYSESFEQRSREGHIKRCHGDLKTSNLWVRPAWCQRIGIQRFRKEVLVLDCIDFNPEFYNIDTLSDIAMLGVDIEMHTMVDQSIQQQENLSEYFLYSYLKEAGEDRQSVRPLLEYYLAEKAMVRAFMCVLYDSQLLLGEKYL